MLPLLTSTDATAGEARMKLHDLSTSSYPSQIFQKPLIHKCSVSHIGILIMILEDLGSSGTDPAGPALQDHSIRRVLG